MVALLSALAAGLAFFSGFGLGTLLLPVFALFFSVDTAIAATAVVHFLNNLFKFGLMWRHIDRQIAVRFGLPAWVGAGAGAWLLIHLAGWPPVATYTLWGSEHTVTPVKLAIACLMVGFAWYENKPDRQKIKAGPHFFMLGGLLSGFFGGLSGHQGALRSAFLTQFGLSKESFIGTGVAIACLVDATRLTLYAGHLAEAIQGSVGGLLPIAVSAALAGTWAARHFLHAVTMRIIRNLVVIGMVLIACGLGSGLL
jgi:uncharacterized membrane protein YfcA